MHQVRTHTSYAVILSFLALILFSPENISICHAALIEINIENNAVEVVAHDAPFIDVLKELADLAEFKLVLKNTTDEIVTFSLKAENLEACVERLLARQNYVMTYGESESNELYLKEVWFIGDGTPIVYQAQNQTNQDSRDVLKRITRAWYQNSFSDTDKLSAQIASRELESSSDPLSPLPGGIHISRVSENSVFAQIGIKAGDKIQDVNGTHVTSNKGLIEALQIASKSGSTTIRIERMDQNNLMNPIYIELY